MLLAHQQGVTAGGHVAGRDVTMVTNYLPVARNQISLLYERLRGEASQSSTAAISFIEDLQHYIDRPATKIARTLREKLVATNRNDLIEAAEEAKERAMKRIMRFQSSQTAQEIFAFTLGELHTRFNHHVRPLIAAGATRPSIDAAIFENVLKPVADSAEPSDLGVNPLLAESLLYFLAGNCHICWD